MNEKETRQYVHDKTVADEAIRDENNNEHHLHYNFLNPFPSDQQCHDQKVYDTAWRESRDHSR